MWSVPEGLSNKKIFQNLLEMRGKAKCIALLFLQLYKVTWQTFLALVYFRFLGSYKVETQKNLPETFISLVGKKQQPTPFIIPMGSDNSVRCFFFHRILLFS